MDEGRLVEMAPPAELLTKQGGAFSSMVRALGPEVLGGVQAMLLRSTLGNLAAYIPTSCPTTEKQGWLGDALFARWPLHMHIMQLVESR